MYVKRVIKDKFYEEGLKHLNGNLENYFGTEIMMYEYIDYFQVSPCVLPREEPKYSELRAKEEEIPWEYYYTALLSQTNINNLDLQTKM